MKIIQIKASQFFELLKMKDTSMWEIFAQMIDGEEKILFNYILPVSLEQLNKDREQFAKEYAEKLSHLN